VLIVGRLTHTPNANILTLINGLHDSLAAEEATEALDCKANEREHGQANSQHKRERHDKGYQRNKK